MKHVSRTKEDEFIWSYEKYSEAIFRHCYYRVFDREKAKDFSQEAFFRTWKYISEGKQVDNIRAFVYRTANNIIIDESRKNKPVSLDSIMEKGFSPKVEDFKFIENKFASQKLIKIINSLDEKYRDVVIMKYIDGLSSKEIAKVIGEKENNVYVRIHRALEKIKEILKNYDIQEI